MKRKGKNRKLVLCLGIWSFGLASVLAILTNVITLGSILILLTFIFVLLHLFAK